MKLAVEVTTCTAERTGVGYYTEHLVDALHRHRAARRRGGPDRQPRAGAGRRRASGATACAPAAFALRYLWMQRDAGRMLEAAGRRLRALPQLPGAAGRPLPVRQRGPRSGAHPNAAVLQPPQARAHAAAACRWSRAARSRSARFRRPRAATSPRCSASPRTGSLMLPGAPHPACRPAGRRRHRARAARYGLAAPLHRVRRDAGAAQEPAARCCGRSIACARGPGRRSASSIW